MKTRMMFTILCLVILGTTDTLHAQCKMENKAFQAGETLEYTLHFNWKFIWVKAGTATLTTQSTTWNGKPCYKSHLITRTNKRLDKFFAMRDTLLSIVGQDLVPYYYKKAANEGGKYYVDEVWYDYKGGRTHLKQHYLNRHGIARDTANTSAECVYDMLSMMLSSRSYDASRFREGEKLVFPMADGRKIEPTTLIYRGKKNFRMEDSDTTYRCLVFSFVEYEKKKEKEIITFYITDDDNHTPVRLDLFLRFGTAKAFLNKAGGLRNPSTSIVSR